MTAVNRIATHLNTPADRSRVWSDALFAAVAALQAQLSHADAEVVREAAGVLIDLEKTRLRHDRPLAGCAESGPHTACAVEPDPHTACADHSPDPLLSATPEEQLALLDRLTAFIDTMDPDDDEEDEELAEEPPPVSRPTLADRLHARFAARGRTLEPAQT